MPETPAYLRIAADLRARIATGDLPPGAKLPSETKIMDAYGVSRTVAKWAIASLKSAGLVEGRRGSGVYVRTFARITRSSPARLARKRREAGQAIQDADTGARPRTVDVTVAKGPAPDVVAMAFGVEPGAVVLIRARRFTVEDRPVQLATSYLPLDVTGGTRIERKDPGPGGIYARLAEIGHTPVRFTERVTARAPRPEEVDGLALESPVAGQVIEIVRHAYTEADRCVEVTVMVLDASAYELEYHFTA